MKAITYARLEDEKGIAYTRQYIAKLEKAGKFPRHFNLSRNTICWDEAEIDAWLESRKAAGTKPKKLPEALKKHIRDRKAERAAGQAA